MQKKLISGITFILRSHNINITEIRIHIVTNTHIAMIALFPLLQEPESAAI